MKQFIKRVVLLVTLCMMTMAYGYAQQPSNVEVKVKELVKKYENVEGVECMVIEKGIGLGMIKMMLNSQFGKDFKKGVTSIIIIEYSDASQEFIHAMHNELDTFKTMLEEVDTSEDEELAASDYVRSFMKVSADEKTISDFIFVMEDKESKMLMYMAGKIKIE
ncbi:MAG: DUF4252 domain-containing protein [Alistipes sp.]|nr:DUF4252 domain-containing protein [Alistipes sp.]